MDNELKKYYTYVTKENPDKKVHYVAGNKLKKLSDKQYNVPDEYKDLGDMKIEDVRNFINSIKGG